MEFIKIEDTRIKISNIKQYGISQETFYSQKIYKQSGNHWLRGREWTLTDELNPINSDLADGVKSERIGKCVYLKKGDMIGKRAYGEDYDYADKDGIYFLDVNESKAKESDIVEETIRYLYVTTYQGDNFTFYENKCNIDERISKLDMELTM